MFLEILQSLGVDKFEMSWMEIGAIREYLETSS